MQLPPRVSDLKFDNGRPKDLEVIEKCLEKDPRSRFEAVSDLMERLQVFSRREQLKIANIIAARTRKKVLMIVAGVLVVAAVCVAGFIGLSHH